VCHSVFDILTDGYRAWWVPIVVLLMAGAALVINNTVGIAPAGRPQYRRMFDTIFVVSGLCVAGLIFWATYSDYAHLRNAVRSGNFEVVEGTVSQFAPADSGDHVPETFAVGKHRYQYSWAVITAGFHRTAPHGGPIRDGLHVRIYDVSGQIARLEICNTSTQ